MFQYRQFQFTDGHYSRTQYVARFSTQENGKISLKKKKISLKIKGRRFEIEMESSFGLFSVAQSAVGQVFNSGASNGPIFEFQ